MSRAAPACLTNKDAVKDAPRIDADGHLSPAEEEELYRYYLSEDYAAAGTQDTRAADAAAGTTRAAGTTG